MSALATQNKPTQAQITERRTKLKNIMLELWDNNNNPTDKALLENMIKIYPSYDRNNLYVDKLSVKADDNFVTELSVFTYSSMMRDIFNKIEYIENESKKSFEDPSGFARVNSMKIYLDCQKLKADILEGKVLDVSVELLGKKLRKLIEEKRDQANK